MNTVLILSGGKGSRMGTEVPKQYIEVGGKPILYYSMKTLMLHEMVDSIQVVAESEYDKDIRELAKMIAEECGHPELASMFKGISAPGENRQLSILNGLKDIKKYASDADTVLIHDAARPCLTPEMISECYAAIIGHEGVLPVLPMKDTVYMSSNGKQVSTLLDRSRIFAGQAPELFLIGKYYDAIQELLPDKILDVKGSTEPAVIAGMDVVMIPGDENNYKITTMADLERFKLEIGM